ncbi:MAG: transcription antitermination factor NusB [Clostridium sp.]
MIDLEKYDEEKQKQKLEEVQKDTKKQIKNLSRRDLRENAFKIVFSSEFEKQTEEKVEIYCQIHNIKSEQDIKYLKQIVRILNNNIEYIQKEITDKLRKDWEYSRIQKVSKALLKLAIIEIEYLKLDYKIAINEAINISKRYQDTKNTKFVNGVLATYVKTIGDK